ncbi:magnesium transporter CorA, partial [Avibacterium paragallinarum]
MINAFALEKARLIRLDDGDENLNAAIWIDLLEPSSEEREMLQQGLGQSLASFLELEDIEASARFFEDEDGLHLHSFFLL